MVAGAGLRNPLDGAPEGLELCRCPLAQSVDPRLVRRRRLHLDHLAQGIEHLVLASVEVRKRKESHWPLMS